MPLSPSSQCSLVQSELSDIITVAGDGRGKVTLLSHTSPSVCLLAGNVIGLALTTPTRLHVRECTSSEVGSVDSHGTSDVHVSLCGVCR